MRDLHWQAGLAANALILAVLVYAGWLEGGHEEFFYRSMQEDEYLEWATFWAFLLAAVACGVAAWWQRRETGEVPWFMAGLGLFCFGVGMEEISWGQRVFAYRPPAYFLEHNFQQEFNVHNVVDSDLRKLAFRVVIAGYGIALPALALVPALRRLLDRLGVVAPTPVLIPAFAAMLWTTIDYPWKFTNEVVELMLGYGFLFAVLAHFGVFSRALSLSGAAGRALTVVVAGLLVLGLGVANAAVSRSQRGASEEAVVQAKQELEALRRDLETQARENGGRRPVRCKTHKRIYSLVEKYDEEFLYEGAFAALRDQGLPEERAEFFIDPWNYAYWIRSTCSDSRGTWRLFVYSFGPNQRRDSTRWELGGDDVGVYLTHDDV